MHGLDVEIVRGDILDPDSVASAVAGCGRVYHAAAGFLMWAQDPEHDIIRPSVDGTRNVMKAAAKAGVEKVLYVSTGGTIGFSPTPDDPHDGGATSTRTPARRTSSGKIAAEKEAFAIGEREKLPVTAINPGLILGPRFWKPSESMRQVVDFLNTGLPVYFDGRLRRRRRGGRRDAARCWGWTRAATGERYIVSGENVTVKHLFELVAELSGLSAPQWKMPVIALACHRHGDGSGQLGDRMAPHARPQPGGRVRGRVRLLSIRARRSATWASPGATHATRVRRTVAWAIDRGFVTEGRRSALQPHPSLHGAY